MGDLVRLGDEVEELESRWKSKGGLTRQPGQTPIKSSVLACRLRRAVSDPQHFRPPFVASRQTRTARTEPGCRPWPTLASET